jgi:V/A-type H+-transporting ATPase subunit F
MAKETKGRIAVVGEHDSVMGFRAVGCAVFPTAGSQETLGTLRELARTGWGAIFLTETAADNPQVREYLAVLSQRTLPVVTLIPSLEGSRGLAMGALRANAEKAIGADVLFQRKG